MRAILLAGALLALLPAAAHADYTAKRDGFTLRVTGDDAADSLALRLAPGDPGTLQIDVGDDGTAEFEFARSTFNAIVVTARGGDDAVRIDQSNGAFADEAVTLDGGGGADTLTGGVGAELLIGGSGNDVVDGNLGVDLVRLGSGADRFNWDPGDGSDTVEGQGGFDVLDFNASNAAETIDLLADGPHVRLARNIGNVAMDLDGIERVALRTLGGSDTVTVDDLTGTELDVVDVDLGADGAPDTVTARGTEGPDAIDVGAAGVSGVGARTSVTGADENGDVLAVAALGGDDAITSGAGIPGTAVMAIDGGPGADTAHYAGTPGDDVIPVFSNGAFASVATPGSARVETIAVEDLVVLAGRGADRLSATGNLAALTRLTFDGGAGDDTIGGGNGADTLIGGAGNDIVDGNQGSDVALLGSGHDTFNWDPGDGSDTVEGQTGTDVMEFQGNGASEILEASANGSRARFTRNVANVVMDLDDVERIAPRTRGGVDAVTVNDLTGTDVGAVEVDVSAIGDGGDGDGAADTVTARGTDGDDAFKIDASGVTGVGARTSITGADAFGDALGVAALGGADTITSGAGIPGTAVMAIDGGDGADTTRYAGTPGDDVIPVFSNGAFASVATPGSARVETIAVEDLIVSAGGGADALSGTGNLAALTRLTFDGGAGDDTIGGGNGADTLIGGAGNDVVDGQQGADVAFLGSGNDTFAWDPGDGSDTIEGQGGADTLAFNGSNAAELFDVAAHGPRVRFTRNVASITMDMDDVERLALRALGGNDTVTVNDLSATDMGIADVDLGAFGGGGDLAQDTVIVNGTDAADAVRVNRVADTVVTAGLAAQTRIAGSELLNDTLRINTLAGDDTVTVDPNAELLITPVIDLGADG